MTDLDDGKTELIRLFESTQERDDRNIPGRRMTVKNIWPQPYQSGSEDQKDNDLAFAADTLPPTRLPNTRGFEPT